MSYRRRAILEEKDVRNVFGIGNKKADELRRMYNIRTTDNLREYTKKIPNLLTPVQQEGLLYHEKINMPIKRELADKHVKFISKVIPHAMFAGSYRRKLPFVGDIDIVVTGQLDVIIDKLKKSKYIVSELVTGDEKFSGIGRIPGSNSYRRIDIIKTVKEAIPFAMLYFTGDYVQNINMRQKAKRMKYSLSQHGLKNLNTGKMVNGIKTEEDIFKYLKMDYKKPEERTHSLVDKTSIKQIKKSKLSLNKVHKLTNIKIPNISKKEINIKKTKTKKNKNTKK